MLHVSRLEKIFEQRSVLYIEELQVAPGEVLAIVGPSSSGKSLLLRILAGTLPPSGGTVTFDGQDIYASQDARSRIGALFEDDLLYKRLSAQENLDFYRRLHRLPRSRVGEILTMIGLNDQARLPASKLSSSAQRRLAFARLLLRRPALYLLDQPILRCDQPTQELFARLIAQITQEGTPVVMADESLAWMGRLCTRIVELQDGHVIGSRSAALSVPEASSDLTDATAAIVVPDRLTPFRVPARKEDSILLLDPGDILYATSREGKTIIHTVSDEATSNLTLQELELRLSGRGFFKSHRAYLVNLQHIKAVIQFTRNSYTLQLKDAQGTMIPLSKQYERELQELLGY